MVSLIVAMDRQRVIGVDNKLPWSLPADLKRFKALTLGHHIVMGRKTFESIGRALPGRTTVIVTRQKGYAALPGCVVVHSLEAAMMTSQGDSEVFVIGGGELFTQALTFADRLYITEIAIEVSKGDAYFPRIDEKRWALVERVDHEPDDKNKFPYSYLTYAKKT